MDKKNTDQQPDQTPTGMIDDAATHEAETASVSTEEDKPQPSRSQRFFRKALIWLVVLVITFSAGMAVDHFLRFKPLSNEYAEAQSALEQTRQELSDMQADLDEMRIMNQEAEDSIAKLETEKKALQDEIETTVTHLQLIQVLVDVSNARVALFLEDIEEAKDTLINTQERLEELLPRIAEYDPALAQDLPQRLNLIISGLDRDTGTVIIDLELITGDLLDIEEAVFSD